MQPQISVIIPLSSFDAYAEEAILSLSRQTEQNFEVIALCLEKGMPLEKIQELLKGCGKESSLFEIEEKNYTSGLNLALKKAKGTFITFLMPTDFYHPDRLRACLAKMKDEEAEFIFTKVHPIDEKGNSLNWENKFWRWKQLFEFHAAVLPTIGFSLLQDNMAVSLGNMIFSRRIAQKIGSFKDYKLHYAYDFALKALLLAEPLFLQEELYFYRAFPEREILQIDHDPSSIRNKEIQQIRSDYLTNIFHPPENRMTPCHHYWPMSFPAFRLKLGLDIGIEKRLDDAEGKPISSMPIKSSDKSLGEKITLFVHELSLSGAPKVAADLALILKEEGYSPNVIALKDGLLRGLLEGHQIPVDIVQDSRWYFEKGFWKKLLSMGSMAWQMWRKSHKTTIAIATLTWPALLISILAFPWRKFIWYLHDSYPGEAIFHEGLPFRMFQRGIKRKNLRFWFGSQATRTIWEKAEVTGELLYWSGIAKEEKTPKKKTEIKNLLSVGSGYPRKGAHFLIEAFAICVKDGLIPEDVSLTIVGFPQSYLDLCEFVSDVIVKTEASGLRDRIRLLKTVELSKLEELYEGCDLYLQPSFLECLPISILKAMSKGIPVITSDVDGCLEAIHDGINGYTCPARNSAILAEKIADAVNHPLKAHEMGLKAKGLFEQKFSTEVTIPLLLQELRKERKACAYYTKLSHDKNKKLTPLTEAR